MEDLLVLGIVPNTDIQISFFGWMLVVVSVICLLIVTRQVVHHFPKIRALYLGRKALRLMSRYHLL